jgi:selenophosphate synthetase-related protein
MFTAKNITAAVIGTVTAQRIITVGFQGARELLFDLAKEDITGIARDNGLQNMPV